MIRAKIYLDEDVDIIVADMFRSQGYVALTTQEAKRKSFSDSDQLKFATENGMAILTHNRTDYETLAIRYFESGLTHAGIIISVQRLPRSIATRTFKILQRYSAEEIINQVYYI